MNAVARTIEPGTPSAVGSLPHTDEGEAARLAITMQPELPAAPQLPRRNAKESMIAQAASGIRGITIDDDGAIANVDRRRLAPPADEEVLDPQSWAGALSFIQTAAALKHRGPIKLQLAGPVTLGLALTRAGAKPAKAFAVASATVRHHVKALVDHAGRTLEDEPRIVLVLDEPGLTAYPTPDFPLGADETIDLLSGGMAAAGPNAMVGIHCCGPTDWRLVLHAGPDLVSLPVDVNIVDDAGGLATFLDRGGWVAWGAIPTDRPLGERDEPYWRRLSELWSELARNGCDPMRLRTQAIVTPACGLALHHPSQVGTIYRLVRRLAERVQDQAIAARMSAGA
ncbi:MAG: hypothetical protein QOF60_2118 [Actinomycetota bacterium]|jgi:hypothetical protein|nr:hypothetical protein [Actinomycetota bacterium]